MIEALIGLVVAVFILAVFGAPAWAIKCGSFGGLGFFIYVCILVLEWIFGRIRALNP